jgi:DNA-directed RNA polymerase specialized sigma24 family protein
MKERIRKKGQFHLVGFLYSYFFYLLKKNVDVFLIDQLGRKSFPLLNDEAGAEEEEEGSSVGFKAPAQEVDMDRLMCTEDVNEMWVLGENCSEPFNQLTVQERQLLKWRYVDGLRSSDISKKITEHPNTVREHLSNARAKIKEIVINSKLEDIMYLIK